MCEVQNVVKMDRAKIIGDWRLLNYEAMLWYGFQGYRSSAASDAV